MDLNNIFAFGSTVDVLLICNYETKIGDRTYAAGEPFTFLHSVRVSIDSQAETPQTVVNTPSRKGLQLVDSTNYLYRFTIDGVTISRKIKDLFFSPRDSVENVESISSIDYPQIKLEHTPTRIFLFKHTLEGEEPLDTSDYSLDGDWLTLNINFNPYEEAYFGFYYYNDEGFDSFISKTYPYFKAVVYGEGNRNGESSSVSFVFDKLSLMPMTNFDFAGSTQNSLSLVFGIIDPDKTVSVKL